MSWYMPYIRLLPLPTMFRPDIAFERHHYIYSLPDNYPNMHWFYRHSTIYRLRSSYMYLLRLLTMFLPDIES